MIFSCSYSVVSKYVARNAFFDWLFSMLFRFFDWLSWSLSMVNNVVMTIVGCSKDEKLSLDSRRGCTYWRGKYTWQNTFTLYHHFHRRCLTVYMVMITQGLKVFKLDWMSVWKFIVPYRDPSLLPRQWRTAIGTQKSYISDASKKAKRRLYESERKKLKSGASETWHISSRKKVRLRLPFKLLFCIHCRCWKGALCQELSFSPVCSVTVWWIV